jgi:hypothetical protein
MRDKDSRDGKLRFGLDKGDYVLRIGDKEGRVDENAGLRSDDEGRDGREAFRDLSRA